MVHDLMQIQLKPVKRTPKFVSKMSFLDVSRQFNVLIHQGDNYPMIFFAKCHKMWSWSPDLYT